MPLLEGASFVGVLEETIGSRVASCEVSQGAVRVDTELLLSVWWRSTAAPFT
jgi:hypothetical protein